jgi:hypothetical protein
MNILEIINSCLAHAEETVDTPGHSGSNYDVGDGEGQPPPETTIFNFIQDKLFNLTCV